MKIKRFEELNENWKDDAMKRKEQYIEIFDEIIEFYSEKLNMWKQDTTWAYTEELYSMISSLLQAGADGSQEHDAFIEKLEKINQNQ